MRFSFLFLTIPLLGCTGFNRVLDVDLSDGDGGTSATTPDDGGDLFDVDVGTSCCIDLAPFEGLSILAEAGTPCPGGTTEGATLHAELTVEPHACSGCTCSPASCTLPGGIHTHAAKCPGDGAMAFPFGPGAAWDGACSVENAIPAGQSCEGAPCVQSLTIPAVAVSPCVPSDPVASLPDPTWGRTVQQCDLDLSAEGCDPGQACAREPPEGFVVCLHAKGDSLQCPPGHDRFVFYEGMTDERGCESCTCGPTEGAQCEALIAVSKDSTCSSLVLATTVGTAGPECVDVLSGSALGSVEASPLSWTPGTCAPGGGAEVGAVEPSEPWTLCCRESVKPVP